MIKIEQATRNGVVVINYDNILKSKLEILSLLNKKVSKLNDISINIENKYFSINYKNKTINIYFKNLTYVGSPHPKHIKRIQIGLSEEELKEYKLGKLHIVGIYYYDSNLTFIFPKLSKIDNRKWNNSSIAYIHTIDLLECLKYGNFKKTDKNNNTIYLFQEFGEMLDFIISGNFAYKNHPIKVLENFVQEKLDTIQTWYGKLCYQEMISKDFKNKFQAEWIGFYFEYLFSDYLVEKNISENIFRFLNFKNNYEIFDLWILDSFYGDLKTHSLNSNAILGNDGKTVADAIKKHGKVWLITLFHNPIYDKEYNYQLSKFWNGLQKKQNLDSYKNKMKNRTLLSKILVLEITKQNQEYLKIFNQGKNSDRNNSIRKPKIKIDNKDLENFVIYRKFLNNQ